MKDESERWLYSIAVLSLIAVAYYWDRRMSIFEAFLVPFGVLVAGSVFAFYGHDRKR